MLLRRKKIDSGFIEKRIVYGAIVSTDYLYRLKAIYKSDYIQSNVCRELISLCLDYYERYQRAPAEEIKNLLDLIRNSLTEEEWNLVQELLNSVDLELDDKFNYEYLLDITIEYFKKRSLELIFDRGKNLLMVDKISSAEELLLSYSKIEKVSRNWTDPFSVETLRDFFLNEDEQNLFSFPGAAERYLGSFCREWLVGFMAPMKRGKSWLLLETAVQALSERLKVVFVSLEMSRREVLERFYKRLIGFAKVEEEVEYPMYVCKRAFDKTCPEKVKNTYCTKCRENENDSWLPEIRIEKTKPKVILDKIKDIKKKLNAFKKTFGQKKLRIITYPAFSASISDLIKDLDNLERAENFVPDVIIVDYADILRPMSGMSKREQIDDIWKKLKGLAAERHCLIVTASQSNRPSIGKRILEAQDIAEDIGKIAHCDVMIGINQTQKERKDKIIRLNLVVHRHRKILEGKALQILQCLDLGQPLLDCEIVDDEQQ